MLRISSFANLVSSVRAASMSARTPMHRRRSIGVLADIEAARTEDTKLANELMRSIQPRHRELLYVTLFLHDIAKGRIEDHSIAGARVARNLCPRLGFSPAETETVAWLIEVHLLMSTVARSIRPDDDRELQRGGAVGRAPQAAHHSHRRRHQGGRSGRVERLEGAAH